MPLIGFPQSVNEVEFGALIDRLSAIDKKAAAVAVIDRIRWRRQERTKKKWREGGKGEAAEMA